MAPVLPPVAVRQGITGAVRVLVTLDAASQVSRAIVLTTSNPVLNEAATFAAIQTTFRTQVTDCVATDSDYVFNADFLPGDRFTKWAGAPAVEVTAIGSVVRAPDAIYVYASIPALGEPGGDSAPGALVRALEAYGLTRANVTFATQPGVYGRRLVTIAVPSAADAFAIVSDNVGRPSVAYDGWGFGLRDAASAFEAALAAAADATQPRAQAAAGSIGRRLGERRNVVPNRTVRDAVTFISLRNMYRSGSEAELVAALRPAAVEVRAAVTATYLLLP